jgi:hypothetical protein
MYVFCSLAKVTYLTTANRRETYNYFSHVQDTYTPIHTNVWMDGHVRQKYFESQKLSRASWILSCLHTHAHTHTYIHMSKYAIHMTWDFHQLTHATCGFCLIRSSERQTLSSQPTCECRNLWAHLAGEHVSAAGAAALARAIDSHDVHPRKEAKFQFIVRDNEEWWWWQTFREQRGAAYERNGSVKYPSCMADSLETAASSQVAMTASSPIIARLILNTRTKFTLTSKFLFAIGFRLLREQIQAMHFARPGCAVSDVGRGKKSTAFLPLKLCLAENPARHRRLCTVLKDYKDFQSVVPRGQQIQGIFPQPKAICWLLLYTIYHRSVFSGRTREIPG